MLLKKEKNDYYCEAMESSDYDYVLGLQNNELKSCGLSGTFDVPKAYLCKY